MGTETELIYIEPDWARPLDIDRLIAKVPETATVKGLFIDGIEKTVAGIPDGKKRLYEGMPRSRYIPFKDYPRGEVMRVEARSAEILFPNEPLRLGIRLTAQKVYPIFLSSLMGKVVFGILGNDVESVLRLGPKGNRMVTSFGVCESRRIADRHWRYHFRDYYSFLDCGDVGIIEGLLLHYGLKPQVKIARVDTFEMWADIRWS